MAVSPCFVDATALQRAAALLEAGAIIAHPTETLYGLAVNPFDAGALERLSRLKRRSPGQAARKGFILLVSGVDQLQSLLLPPPPLAQRLIKKFWPGPLTLVLPARPGLPAPLTGGGDHLAVRHSPAPLVRELLAVWKNPLVSTSANVSGQPPLNSGRAVHRQWGRAVSLVLEDPRRGDIGANAPPSTVLRVAGDRARLLRHGALSRQALLTVIPAASLQDDAGTVLR